MQNACLLRKITKVIIMYMSLGRILGRNQSKVLFFAIHSHLYSFALRFLFLQTHATSYSFLSSLLYTVKEKGGNLIENNTPFTIV